MPLNVGPGVGARLHSTDWRGKDPSSQIQRRSHPLDALLLQLPAPPGVPEPHAWPLSQNLRPELEAVSTKPSFPPEPVPAPQQPQLEHAHTARYLAEYRRPLVGQHLCF